MGAVEKVFVPDMVWLLVVRTDKEVEAPAGFLNNCTLKPFTVVEAPLVLAADNVTVDPLSAAVKVS